MYQKRKEEVVRRECRDARGLGGRLRLGPRVGPVMAPHLAPQGPSARESQVKGGPPWHSWARVVGGEDGPSD